MDAKDLRTEPIIRERNEHSANYSESDAHSICSNRHLLEPSALPKVDIQSSRPCAIIGPDRIISPQSGSSDVYDKKTYAEWDYTNNGIRRPPDYYQKISQQPYPSRNISPRQTYQENMQRIMVPPRFDTGKISDVSANLITERQMSKNSTMDPKFCDVPYTVTPIQLEQRPRNGEMSIAQSAMITAQNWTPSSAVPGRPLHPQFSSSDLQRYSEYPNYPMSYQIPVGRPHRVNPEEASHNIYPEQYYRPGNVRYEPYPSAKDRFSHVRYEYVNNYPASYNPTSYPQYKAIPPQAYMGYNQIPLKYLEPHLSEPPVDTFQRPMNQMHTYNTTYRNNGPPSNYAPALNTNCLPGKLFSYSNESTIKLNPLAKNSQNNSSKIYSDYDHTRLKNYQHLDNSYINESVMPNQLKGSVTSTFPSFNAQTLPPHPSQYQRNENLNTKSNDYPPQFKTMAMPNDMNYRLARLHQISSKNLYYSNSNANMNNTHVQGVLPESCYINHNSLISGKSVESNKMHNFDVYRKYDNMYVSYKTSPILSKTELNLKKNNTAKDKKNLDVRQFLQMWNEGDDENSDGNCINTLTAVNSKNSDTPMKYDSTPSNSDQLYVLGLVNVPSEDLSKYEHIEKVSKLPENIKGYNNLELLHQFEKVIGTSNVKNNYKKIDISVNTNRTLKTKDKNSLARPLSPLDVEAKISQSVIHKEVGCNFEIKPCSPKMLNVDVVAPAQTLSVERQIEKVMNPHIVQSIPLSSMRNENVESYKIIKPHAPRQSFVSAEVSSCKMIEKEIGENKTNYNLQEFDTNSGVCLASLPRLDNDIEFNFPEVNQQFLDANKIDSVIISNNSKNTCVESCESNEINNKYTPYLETVLTTQVTENPASDGNIDGETNRHADLKRLQTADLLNCENPKESSKLCKFRKVKNKGANVSINCLSNTERTDSVIIKKSSSADEIIPSLEESTRINFDESGNELLSPINLSSAKLNIADCFNPNFDTLQYKNDMKDEETGIVNMAINLTLDSLDDKDTQSNDTSFTKNKNNELREKPPGGTVKRTQLKKQNNLNQCLSTDSEVITDSVKENNYTERRLEEKTPSAILKKSQSEQTILHIQQDNSKQCFTTGSEVIRDLVEENMYTEYCMKINEVKNTTDVQELCKVNNVNTDNETDNNETFLTFEQNHTSNEISKTTKESNTVKYSQSNDESIEHPNVHEIKIEETKSDNSTEVSFPIQFNKSDQRVTKKYETSKTIIKKYVEQNDLLNDSSNSIISSNSQTNSQDNIPNDIDREKFCVIDKINNDEINNESCHNVCNSETMNSIDQIVYNDINNIENESLGSKSDIVICCKTSSSFNNTIDNLVQHNNISNNTNILFDNEKDDSKQNLNSNKKHCILTSEELCIVKENNLPYNVLVQDSLVLLNDKKSDEENIQKLADQEQLDTETEINTSPYVDCDDEKQEVSRYTVTQTYNKRDTNLVPEAIVMTETKLTESCMTSHEKKSDLNTKCTKKESDIETSEIVYNDNFVQNNKACLLVSYKSNSNNCTRSSIFMKTKNQKLCSDKIYKSLIGYSHKHSKELFSPQIQNLLIYLEGIVIENIIPHVMTPFNNSDINEIQDIVNCEETVPEDIPHTEIQGTIDNFTSDGCCSETCETAECLSVLFNGKNHNIDVNSCEAIVDLYDHNSSIENSKDDKKKLLDSDHISIENFSKVSKEFVASVDVKHDAKNKSDKLICENKVLSCVDYENHRNNIIQKYRLKRRHTRSLSESALPDHVSESHKNVSSMICNAEINYSSWSKKRKTANDFGVNDIQLNNNSNTFACSRRNSIASIYNEENVSVCILIGNNCLISDDSLQDIESNMCYSLHENEIIGINEEPIATTIIVPIDNNEIQIQTMHCEKIDNCEASETKDYADIWVDDVGCIETVVSEEVLDELDQSNINLSLPVEIENEDRIIEHKKISGVALQECFGSAKMKTTDGHNLQNKDNQLIETLYKIPQINIFDELKIESKTLIQNMEENIHKNITKCIDTYKLADGTNNINNALKLSTLKPVMENNEQITKEPVKNYKNTFVFHSNSFGTHSQSPVEENTNTDNFLHKSSVDTVHINTCETKPDYISFQQKRAINNNASSSPEVSSTTSEERSILLSNIANYDTSRISYTNSENSPKFPNRGLRCKLTEVDHYGKFENSKNVNLKPLITKAAQKYIPPLRIYNNFKVKLPLPESSLLKLKQLKISKDVTKSRVQLVDAIAVHHREKEVTKKIKPNFEDVLKNIDEVQYKLHKSKYKLKHTIPKVVIKKNENGSHYASTSKKQSYNPDLTGRKWQPWVFIEKNQFIDKMAVKNKTKAIYCYDKNTYVVAEKIHKNKHIDQAIETSTKLVISRPKDDDSRKVPLKYTIKLKHTY